MDNPKEQLVNQLKEANNVLITVSANPSVDQLAGAIGLTLFLTKMRKHATAVFSGKVPSTIEFLKPEQTIEGNTDSLQDFIIALDKAKADKIRYKVEDQMVKIFITPYRTSIGQGDLVFSKGDFNVDIVVALGVKKKEELDQAITAHGRILHDATVTTINTREGAELGSLNWTDPQASSLCEMVVSLSDQLKPNSFDSQIATALLTGIVAETERFSNEKTDSQTMNAGAKLMAAGANQQLVAAKLEEAPPPVTPSQSDEGKSEEPAEESIINEDGSLVIHHEEKQKKPEEKPAEKLAPAPAKAPEKPKTPKKQPEPETKPEEEEKKIEQKEPATPPEEEGEPEPEPEPAVMPPPPKEEPRQPAPPPEEPKEETIKEAAEPEEPPQPEPIPTPTVIEPEQPTPQISISDQGDLQSFAPKHLDIHIKPEHREFLNAPPTTQRHEDDVVGGPAGQSLQPGRIAGPPSMGGRLNAVADDDEDEASPMNLPPVQGGQPLLSHEPAKDQAKAKEPEPKEESPPNLTPAVESAPTPVPPPEPNPVPPPMPSPQPEPPQEPEVPPPVPETDMFKPKLPDSFMKVLDDETLKELEHRTHSPHQTQASTGFEDKTLNNIESSVHARHGQPEPSGLDYEAHESEPPPKKRAIPTQVKPIESKQPEPPTPLLEEAGKSAFSQTPPPATPTPAQTPSFVPAKPVSEPPPPPIQSGETKPASSVDSAREAINRAIANGGDGHADPDSSFANLNLGSEEPAAIQTQGPYPHIDQEGTVTFKDQPADDPATPGHNGTLHTPLPSADPTSSKVADPTPPPPVPPPIPHQYLA